MENSIQIFNNPEFGNLTATVVDDQAMFVGIEVASILGYANPSKAVINHIDEEDKTFKAMTCKDSQNGIPKKTTLINESGVYSLILLSKLPSAKRFKRWVTHEVLPSLRRDGAYVVATEEDDDLAIMAKGLLAAQRAIERKDAQIAEMKPKAVFARSVEASDTCILVGDLAKILKQNGVKNMGQKRLFAWLRDNGYLMKTGNSRNMPTQKSMELGLFEIKERTVNNHDGTVRVTKTPMVTGRGQIYFVNLFLEGCEEVA